MKINLIQKLKEISLDFTLLEEEELKKQLASLDDLVHEYGIARLNGEFRDGKPNGVVTLFMKGGDVEFVCNEGIPQNNMKIEFTNGGLFEGSFPIGTGRLIFPNGICYEGQMKKCMPYGQGVVYLQDGSKIKGMWLDGEIRGNSIYFDKEGNPSQLLFQKEDYNEIQRVQ